MPDPKRRDFHDVLTDLNDGHVHEQLTALWAEVVKKVREVNKPGELTIKLSAKRERGSMLRVDAKVTTKLPAPATGPTLFYTDEEGNTTRNDPKQMPLRNVSALKPQA
jgi:hypothetical protein